MKTLALISLLAAPVTCFAAETVWLSSLDLSKVRRGWGKAQVDRSFREQPLSIAGQKFPSNPGLCGMHIVRGLWRQENFSKFKNQFHATSPRHGVALVSLRSTPTQRHHEATRSTSLAWPLNFITPPACLGLRTASLLLLVVVLLNWTTHSASAAITHETDRRMVVMSDATGSLVLRLNYDGRCLLDQVAVRGGEVVAPDTGVCSAIKVAGQWHTTRVDIPTPRVTGTGDDVTVSDIRYGGGGVQVRETWHFAVQLTNLVWRIDRKYLTGGTLEDTCFPGWDFRDMQTWTGGLLGHGGVAWGKLFDKPNASYGIHNGEVIFWNKTRRACLRIVPRAPASEHVAVRFSRQPSGIFSLNYSVTETELATRHGHSRFLHDRQDVWVPFTVAPGKVSIEFTLSASDYDQTFDRGTFVSLDSAAIRELCHTIARIDRWEEHFALDQARIMGITEVGRVTADLLHLNDDERVLERNILGRIGEYPGKRPGG